MDLLVNTNKINSVANDIANLTSEIDEIIRHLYTNIDSLNQTNGAWIGATATSFINRCKMDRIDLLELNKGTLEYAKYLEYYVTSMSKTILEVKK